MLRHEGVSHFDMDEFDLALERYLAALAIFTELDEPVEIAKTRANIANVYQITDRLPQAIQYHREALGEFERARVPIGVAGSALNLGVALAALAASDRTPAELRDALLIEATASYRKALQIFTALGIDRGVQKAQSNLASVRQRLGDIDAAVVGYTQARELAATIGDGFEEALALRKLMEIELTRGRHADALSSVPSPELPLNLHKTHDPVNEELFQSVASATQEALGVPARCATQGAEELVHQASRCP